MSQGFHAVVPRLDCPHVILPDNYENFISYSIPKIQDIISSSCGHCEESYENWICLTCGSLECSRYINGHMKEHAEANYHNFTLSLVDFSCWCYACNDYIESPFIKRIHDTIYIAKFNEPPQKYSDEPVVLEEKVKELANIINNSKNIVSFTGTGISTSAIKLDEENISPRDNKEETSNSNIFEHSPPKNSYNIQEIKPTLSHKVLKSMCDLKNINHLIVSTNTDTLHKQSGVPEDSLIEIKFNSNNEINPTVLQNIINKTSNSDIFLVIGSSMRISPSNQIPNLAKTNNGKLIIINVQNTPYDDIADIRIWAPIDEVMKQLSPLIGL